jgi:GTP pyrophosphokinase/guanosine-3',5'-bis(diphosphate) 3'-pyrophosphohydrolase
MSELKEIARTDLDDLKLKKAQKQDLNQLLEECREFIGEVDEKQIEKAFKLCYLSHDGMVRASGEPYYYHPVEVAKIVAREINID